MVPTSYLAYASNEKANTVTVIDRDTFEAVKTFEVGQRPRGIEVAKDGQFALVACGDDDIIQMIDTKTDEVTGTLPSGSDPELFSQDPTGELLYVANENDNEVTTSTSPNAPTSATSRSGSNRKAWR
jgi:YVTN family beta-propeller protein